MSTFASSQQLASPNYSPRPKSSAHAPTSDPASVCNLTVSPSQLKMTSGPILEHNNAFPVANTARPSDSSVPSPNSLTPLSPNVTLDCSPGSLAHSLESTSILCQGSKATVNSPSSITVSSDSSITIKLQLYGFQNPGSFTSSRYSPDCVLRAEMLEPSKYSTMPITFATVPCDAVQQNAIFSNFLSNTAKQQFLQLLQNMAETVSTTGESSSLGTSSAGGMRRKFPLVNSHTYWLFNKTDKRAFAFSARICLEGNRLDTRGGCASAQLFIYVQLFRRHFWVREHFSESGTNSIGKQSILDSLPSAVAEKSSSSRPSLTSVFQDRRRVCPSDGFSDIVCSLYNNQVCTTASIVSSENSTSENQPKLTNTWDYGEPVSKDSLTSCRQVAVTSQTFTSSSNTLSKDTFLSQLCPNRLREIEEKQNFLAKQHLNDLAESSIKASSESEEVLEKFFRTPLAFNRSPPGFDKHIQNQHQEVINNEQSRGGWKVDKGPNEQPLSIYVGNECSDINRANHNNNNITPRSDCSQLLKLITDKHLGSLSPSAHKSSDSFSNSPYIKQEPGSNHDPCVQAQQQQNQPQYSKSNQIMLNLLSKPKVSPIGVAPLFKPLKNVNAADNEQISPEDIAGSGFAPHTNARPSQYMTCLNGQGMFQIAAGSPNGFQQQMPALPNQFNSPAADASSHPQHLSLANVEYQRSQGQFEPGMAELDTVHRSKKRPRTHSIGPKPKKSSIDHGSNPLSNFIDKNSSFLDSMSVAFTDNNNLVSLESKGKYHSNSKSLDPKLDAFLEEALSLTPQLSENADKLDLLENFPIDSVDCPFPEFSELLEGISSVSDLDNFETPLSRHSCDSSVTFPGIAEESTVDSQIKSIRNKRSFGKSAKTTNNDERGKSSASNRGRTQPDHKKSSSFEFETSPNGPGKLNAQIIGSKTLSELLGGNASSSLDSPSRDRDSIVKRAEAPLQVLKRVAQNKQLLTQVPKKVFSVEGSAIPLYIATSSANDVNESNANGGSTESAYVSENSSSSYLESVLDAPVEGSQGLLNMPFHSRPIPEDGDESASNEDQMKTTSQPGGSTRSNCQIQDVVHELREAARQEEEREFQEKQQLALQQQQQQQLMRQQKQQQVGLGNSSELGSQSSVSPMDTGSSQSMYQKQFYYPQQQQQRISNAMPSPSVGNAQPTTSCLPPSSQMQFILPTHGSDHQAFSSNHSPRLSIIDFCGENSSTAVAATSASIASEHLRNSETPRSSDQMVAPPSSVSVSSMQRNLSSGGAVTASHEYKPFPPNLFRDPVNPPNQTISNFSANGAMMREEKLSANQQQIPPQVYVPSHCVKPPMSVAAAHHTVNTPSFHQQAAQKYFQQATTGVNQHQQQMFVPSATQQDQLQQPQQQQQNIGVYQPSQHFFPGPVSSKRFVHPGYQPSVVRGPSTMTPQPPQRVMTTPMDQSQMYASMSGSFPPPQLHSPAYMISGGGNNSGQQMLANRYPPSVNPASVRHNQGATGGYHVYSLPPSSQQMTFPPQTSPTLIQCPMGPPPKQGDPNGMSPQQQSVAQQHLMRSAPAMVNRAQIPQVVYHVNSSHQPGGSQKHLLHQQQPQQTHGATILSEAAVASNQNHITNLTNSSQMALTASGNAAGSMYAGNMHSPVDQPMEQMQKIAMSPSMHYQQQMSNSSPSPRQSSNLQLMNNNSSATMQRKNSGGMKQQHQAHSSLAMPSVCVSSSQSTATSANKFQSHPVISRQQSDGSASHSLKAIASDASLSSSTGSAESKVLTQEMADLNSIYDDFLSTLTEENSSGADDQMGGKMSSHEDMDSSSGLLGESHSFSDRCVISQANLYGVNMQGQNRGSFMPGPVNGFMRNTAPTSSYQIQMQSNSVVANQSPSGDGILLKKLLSAGSSSNNQSPSGVNDLAPGINSPHHNHNSPLGSSMVKS